MNTKRIAIVVVAVVAWGAVCKAQPAPDHKSWKNSVGSGNWNVSNNWSTQGPAGTDNGGVPDADDDSVRIVHTTGAAHTVTLNVNTPSLALFAIDLTGPGVTTNTLSITNNFSLTAAGILVGGHSGSAATAGRGAINQSAGNVAPAAGFDLALGLGTGFGQYTLSGTGSLTAPQSEYIGSTSIGQFDQLGGTNTISAGAIGALDIGVFAGSSGTYNLSGGQLISHKSEFVGDFGIGTFNHIGGTNSITGANDLILGNSAGGNGTYNLSGTGILAVGRSMFVGKNNAGMGTFSQTGGSLDAQHLVIGDAAGSTGAYNVSGGTVILSGDLKVGNLGSGTMVISNTANVRVGNQLSVGGVGSLSMNGGTLRVNDLVIVTSAGGGGEFNFNAGTIELVGSRNVGTDAVIQSLFGFLPVIPTGKGLTVLGAATLSTAARLDGGTLKAPSIDVTGTGSLDFDGGVLELTGGAITGLTHLAVPTGGEFRASGTQSLRVTGAPGSTITATGNLTLGNSSAVNGFGTQGTLSIGANTVTLLDANDVVFDSLALATLGGASQGTLSAANGLTLDFGGNLTGFGIVSTPNNIAKPLINNGHIIGNSAAQRVTLPGYVKGAGTFDQVNFTGTFSPGLSPTISVVGSIAFSPTSTLLMELGGTTPGSGHDQLQSSGTLTFDGTLTVSLINGFAPSSGQSFNLFDWASRNGTFDVLQLPTLAGGLNWNTSQLYNTGVLSIAAAAGLLGDFNNSGKVDAADYVRWRKNTTNSALPNDNGLTNQAARFNLWRANFGNMAGSGSGAQSANATVPEPAGFALLLILTASVAGSSSRYRSCAARFKYRSSN